MTTAEQPDALEQGRQAALDGRWEDAIAAFAAAEAAGDPTARALGLRARLNLVRELAPDPLAPPPASVERYVQAVQHLEAGIIAGNGDTQDASEADWRRARLAEMQGRLFDQLRFASSRFTSDRDGTLRMLDNLFLLGTLPAPLNGRYPGTLVTLSPGFGLDAPLQNAAGWWMPWQGKTFDAGTATGENIFEQRMAPLLRVVWPSYLGAHPDGPDRFRAFQFRTFSGAGVRDPERQVLKIDYDVPDNPNTVRRVLDELVQLGSGVWLGKAHVRGLSGGWRTVAYFALRPAADGDAST